MLYGVGIIWIAIAIVIRYLPSSSLTNKVHMYSSAKANIQVRSLVTTDKGTSDSLPCSVKSNDLSTRRSYMLQCLHLARTGGIFLVFRVGLQMQEGL